MMPKPNTPSASSGQTAKKIVALVPTYNTMESVCVASLVNLQAQLLADGHDFKVLFIHNYIHSVARTKLAEQAIQAAADFVLWIDSDMTYTPLDFYKLLKRLYEKKLPMVSAKYYVRNSFAAPRKIAMCNWNEQLKKYEQIIENQATGLQHCDAVGFGFLIMRGNLLKQLKEKHDKLFDMQPHGEDSYFCSLMKKDGLEVCYDAEVKVGHVSTIVNI